MEKASFDQIRNVMTDKGFAFYTSGRFNLNLIGVRAANSKSDQFDDHFHIIYRGEDDRFKHHTFACTTDPGKHWLLNPMNIKGCAIMVPGQYKSAYAQGKHHGDYDALVQSKPMCFVRDNNKDLNLDFSLFDTAEALKKNGFFDTIGANIHRASAFKATLSVGMYSAACQVIQSPTDFDILMKLVPLQDKNGNGKMFTYTLLSELDFK